MNKPFIIAISIYAILLISSIINCIIYKKKKTKNDNTILLSKLKDNQEKEK